MGTYGYVTPTGGFTVECWFWRSAGPATLEALVSQQTQNKAANWSTTPGLNGRHFLLGALNDQLHANLYTEAGAQVFTWSSTAGSAYMMDSAWHHVALRVGTDKRAVTIFLDGEKLVAGTLASAAIDWLPGVMSWGGAYAPHLGNWGYGLWTGGLSYCAVFNKALSDNRILEHRTAGEGGTVYYGDNEVTRLGRLYDAAGVPLSSRQFDDATTTLQGVQIAGEVPLEKIADTADASGGTVFSDGQSTMVYHNRRHRYGRRVSAVLTEETGSAPEVGMEFVDDDTRVYNDVRASRPYGGSVRLRDTESIGEHGQKVYEISLPITSDSEMLNAGAWILSRYANSRLRVSNVSLACESSDLLQYLAETLSLGDVIAFDDLPPNAPATYMEFVVEGMSVSADFKAKTWELSLSLSPYDLWHVFQVGVSTVSDGSRIAF